MRFDVPELVRQRAASAGVAGEQWLRDVPEMARSLAEEWELEIGRVLSGGTASLVLEATAATGDACVVKIAMPFDSDAEAAFDRSVLTHQLAEGEGCVALLLHDRDRLAMLLERLGPSLADTGTPLPELLQTVAATLSRFWRPVDETVALPTGADKAAWLADDITATWDTTGRPCPRRVIDRAVELCAERGRAFDPSTAVLVHADAHGWNTLIAGDGHKFVDPEGLRSDRANDLAVPMREYNEPLLEGDTVRLVWERAELLAGLCGVDPQAVWEWGHIERVSTGLANLAHFDNDHGGAFLEVAARCL